MTTDHASSIAHRTCFWIALCRVFPFSPQFNGIAVIMAHSEYAYADASFQVLKATYVAGTVFAIMWLVEMMLKIAAFGFKGYLVGVNNTDNNAFSMNTIEFLLAITGYTQL